MPDPSMGGGNHNSGYGGGAGKGNGGKDGGSGKNNQGGAVYGGPIGPQKGTGEPMGEGGHVNQGKNTSNKNNLGGKVYGSPIGPQMGTGEPMGTGKHVSQGDPAKSLGGIIASLDPSPVGLSPGPTQGISEGPEPGSMHSDGDTLISSDKNALPSPMAEAMETLLQYSSKGGDPTKVQVPLQRQIAVIPSPFAGQSSGIVA